MHKASYCSKYTCTKYTGFTSKKHRKANKKTTAITFPGNPECVRACLPCLGPCPCRLRSMSVKCWAFLRMLYGTMFQSGAHLLLCVRVRIPCVRRPYLLSHGCCSLLNNSQWCVIEHKIARACVACIIHVPLVRGFGGAGGAGGAAPATKPRSVNKWTLQRVSCKKSNANVIAELQNKLNCNDLIPPCRC